MSEQQSKAKLLASLVRASAAVGRLLNDARAERNEATGKGFPYSYPSLAAIQELTKPALRSEGLGAFATCRIENGCVLVKTTLAHESGEVLSTPELPFVVPDADPRTVGKLFSFGQRYQLLGLMGLSGVDPDGEAAPPQAVDDRPAETPNKEGLRKALERAASHGTRNLEAVLEQFKRQKYLGLFTAEELGRFTQIARQHDVEVGSQA